MHRALRQPHCASRRCGRLDYLPLDMSLETRRRHVDGLLEEGTVERIGLIEDREHSKAPVCDQSFDRHLKPRDEFLNERFARESASSLRELRVAHYTIETPYD